MTTLPKIELTPEQTEAVKDAAGRPWKTAAAVRSAETTLAVTSPDSPHRARFEAELAIARKAVAAQELFQQLACKALNLKSYRANDRPGRCPVTGETVPEHRGVLVQKGGRWLVYSRAAVLQEILAAAAMSHDQREEAGEGRGGVPR
jgi:hypothetical protein